MVIYEISKFPFPMDSIVSFAVTLVILLFVILYGIKYLEKKELKYILICLCLLCVFVLAGSMFLESLRYGGSDEYEYSQKYYSGDYKTVEGKVEEFQSENINGNIRKEFYVNNVYFEQEVFALNFNEMFQKEKTIYKNGQNVEICYVADVAEDESEKVIVKISLVDSKMGD